MAAISHLRTLLNQAAPDRNDDVDWEVMVALLRLHDAESLTAIANRLTSVHGGVAPGTNLYEELARYGDEGALVLLRVLSSTNVASSRLDAAADAVASVRTPEVVSALKAWRRNRR